MVSTNFETCYRTTLQWEGGYSNLPDDPGGPTNLGIIQTEYNAWRRSKGLPLQSVRWITYDEAKAIYKNKYWDVMNCDALPAGLDLAVYDAAVNNGTGRARLWLNRTKDIDAFCDLRLHFDQSLGHLWHVFGAGWSTRIAGIRRQAKKLASGQTIWTTEAIQQALNKFGANPQLSVDGEIGPATVAAIKQFQAAHNLTVDGIAGTQTLEALSHPPGTKLSMGFEDYLRSEEFELDTFIPELQQPAIFKSPQPTPETEPSNRALFEAITRLTEQFEALRDTLTALRPDA